MSFSDFPFIPEAMGPKSHDSRRFPSHTEVQAWLEVFASRFELRQHIKFNSQITALRPIPPAQPNSNPGAQHASAPVVTAPRWKLTVHPSPASKAYTQHATQHTPHTGYASGTMHAATPPPDPLDSVSKLRYAEASTPEPAPVLPSNATAACHIASTPNSNGVHHAQTNGGGQQHDAACTGLPNSGGCSGPQSESEPGFDSQTRIGSSEWLPRTADVPASEQSDCEFDAVVVCVGNYHQPNLPDVTGIDDFPKLQIHAHNYRNPAMFEGQVVIVVGASFSGRVSLLPWSHAACCKVAATSCLPMLKAVLRAAVSVQSYVNRFCLAHC